MDTIFALSTAPGKAGVAMIRVSGPQAYEGLQKLTSVEVPPRVATVVSLTDPQTTERLDQALILYFKAPHSFTGEDVVELHLHGSMAVVSGMLAVLGRLKGHRLAEPGEFTRRAFDHDKLDLAQVDGLADLINAETEVQRKSALRQMSGQLSALYDGWRGRLIKAAAYLEADIDFPDEGDVTDDVLNVSRATIAAITDEIAGHLDDNQVGERLRAGVHVAVIGPPNAGKSTLINMLSQRDVAIVSDIAGTTRDVIEVHLDLGGYPAIVADTAGLRETDNMIEAEGVQRAEKWAQNADITVFVADITAWPPKDKKQQKQSDKADLILLNKADLFRGADRPQNIQNGYVVSISGGGGMEDFLGVLQKKVKEMAGLGGSPALTRARYREALTECRAALDRAVQADLPELIAEDIRLAARHLGRITGRVDVEDLLDVIFHDFCIGK